MEESIQRNINCLPIEVLIHIFQWTAKLAGVKELSTCAIVCKAWLHPVRLALYTDIKITTLPQLEKFCSTVKCSPYLGKQVKVFDTSFFLPPHPVEERIASDRTFDLLSNLLSFGLPNLKELTGTPVEIYISLTKALEYSQLKHLKKINEPSCFAKKEELVNYASCVLLMYDRIEKITIKESLKTNQNSRSDELLCSSLFDKLDRFQNLAELILADDKETTVGIQELEYVLSTCKTLKSLGFFFKEPENEASSNNEISTFAPSYSIKSLIAYINLRNYKIIWYILHKFPQLCSLQLEMDIDSPTTVDGNMLTQLLNYSHNFLGYFGAYYLRIDANHDISQTLGDHWGRNSTPGKERVKVIYGHEEAHQSYNMAESDEYHFDFDKLQEENTFNHIFLYPKRVFQQKYIHFIQKNGKFIGEINFHFSSLYQRSLTGIPGKFISHALKHCPNLHTLRFEQNKLKILDYSEINLSKQLSLDELDFRCCDFFSGSLDRLSLLIPKVKQLRLYIPEFIPDVTYRKTTVEVIMLNTKMDLIILTEATKFFLKLFVVADGNYYFYHFSDKVFEDSSDQEYTEADGFATRVFIGCRTKPRLQWKQTIRCTKLY